MNVVVASKRANLRSCVEEAEIAKINAVAALCRSEGSACYKSHRTLILEIYLRPSDNRHTAALKAMPVPFLIVRAKTRTDNRL